MSFHWRMMLIATSLLVALGSSAALGQTRGDRHQRTSPGHDYRRDYGRDYGHGHNRHYGPSYRRSYAYGWGYAPAYRYGYGSGYGYGSSIGLGYGYYGGHDAYSLFFSLPLYFGPRYYPPAPVAVPYPYVAPQPATRVPAESDCLQTREYQTEITIDEQVLPAYGTACLQADGSWRIISGPILAE